MRDVILIHAPFKLRIYAFLLDYLVIAVYGIFVVGSISFVFRAYMTILFSESPLTAELTGFFMITLPVFLYFAWCDSSKWQGTWGKQKMGIRVVDSKGKRMTLIRSITRTAIKLLPWEIAHFGIWHLMLPSPFSEWTMLIILSAVNLVVIAYIIIPFTNKKQQNVYDWIAGTEVIC